MPVEQLDRAYLPTSQINIAGLRRYDVLIQPDLGGSKEAIDPFNNTIIIAQAADRILPPAESQETHFSSSGSIDFNPDLKRVGSLNEILGIMGRLSHSSAIDRARFERAKTDEERQAVRQGILDDEIKNLYERAHTAQSTVIYHQDHQGRIYNPSFSEEPFDISLQRGLGYSRSQGSVDYQREVKEFEGWKEVMSVLFDPKIALGSKEIIISGPGLKPGTIFTDNFVDIFTKTLDPATREVIVVMTRFASGASYKEYRRIATHFDNNYFSGGEPADNEIDIYFKEHPIFIHRWVDRRDAQQLFEDEFPRQIGATEEEKTKGYIKDEECRLFILNYADAICSPLFEPERVKKAFNAVLNRFDELRKGVARAVGSASKGILEFGRSVAHKASTLVGQAESFLKSLQQAVDHYGRMPVRKIMVGCGLSAGFSIESGGLNGLLTSGGVAILNALINIGTSLGLLESDSKGSLYFPCPACGAINKRPREGYVESCQNSSCPNPKAVRC